MSRSIGDKIAHGVGVINEPEINIFNLDEKCKYIILGSDGIWQYINNMDIEQIEEYINIFKHKIENDVINYYIVDTFSLLSGKAIEYYSKMKSEKQMTFLMQMKTVLSRENVQNILNKNKNVDEEMNSVKNNEII